MSLPTAQKDISAKPASGSVVDPVNKANKDADVDRKIRLYGVISAFRQGRMPSNAQIDSTLQYVLQHSPVDTSKLSSNGQKLISDTRDIIETARIIVQTKNKDELFQNFVWHTRDVDFDTTKVKQATNGDVVPVDKSKAKNDSQQAVHHLRTILSLVLTNSEVRKLLSDFALIGRDLLARGAAKAATKLRPDEERLARVDDTAPQDEFVERGDINYGIQKVRERTDATTSEAKDVKDSHASDIRHISSKDAPVEEKKKGFTDKMKDIRDDLAGRIPQEHKDTISDQYDRGRRFLTEEYFPEERRDQYIYRCKKVILECQKHEDYQDSLKWLISLIEDYVKHGRTAAKQSKDTATGVTSDSSLKQATTELRTLLERFANGQSFDIIINAVNTLVDDAKADQELSDWFSQVDAYVRRVLLEPGFVLEPQCNSTAESLRDSGRSFYDDKYKAHFDNLFSSVGDWFKAMGDDPLNKRFGDDWARLTKDLLFDAEGSLKFKSDLWMDIRSVILPTLVDKVGYIPIPRIEYTDDALDLVVENLTLSGRNLFPNIVSLEAHNFIKFSPYNAINDEGHHEFTFTFAQIQADMRDVAFYFKKKTGMPKLMDSGLADVILGGHGLTITVRLVSADKDKSSVFKVMNVHVRVDTLKFSIRDSKHDFLYKVIKPLATGLVKRQIQKALEGAITTGFEYVDGQLVFVRDRMAEAKVNEGESRTKVLQELFSHQKEETASKTSERHSQFKVVANKRQSLLANAGHPAGWVNRTAEKEDKATQGAEWRSEAFTIV